MANYSSQRRRQYPLERNGVLALAQLAKQISEGRNFAPPTAALPPPGPLTNAWFGSTPIPPVQKAGPVAWHSAAGTAAADAVNKVAEENPWRPLVSQIQLNARATPSAAETKVQPAQTQTQLQSHTSTSPSAAPPRPDSQPLTEPTAPSAGSGMLSLQLHLRGQSDDGERKESETPLSAAPEQPAAVPPTETSRSVTSLLAAGSSSAPLVGSSPRSARSFRSADSTGSDSSWDQWESPSPANAQQPHAD